MDIKLMLLDLDDTLLNSKGELSERTKNAVKNSVDKGIVAAIASGRMHVSLLPYVDKMNTHGPVVSYNGALIKDSGSNEVLYSNPIPLPLARKVLEFAEKEDIFAQFYTEEDYFFEKHCDISEMYFRSTGIRGKELGSNLYEKIIDCPPKILFIEEDLDKIETAFIKLRNLFGESLYITRSKSKYIEVMNQNVNKGQALLMLCEIYGITPEKCMAIGDGLNDIEMIKNAGLGVAVASASEALKEAADIVCECADCDGPAKIIEEMVLGTRQNGGSYGKS